MPDTGGPICDSSGLLNCVRLGCDELYIGQSLKLRVGRRMVIVPVRMNHDQRYWSMFLALGPLREQIHNDRRGWNHRSASAIGHEGPHARIFEESFFVADDQIEERFLWI